ncbi:hypothetical protein P8452_56128 [Trifolium repens]|nr:hypothetical protein QL285_081113 [Trifolium repens]WJX72229.1 hypothetical protein P8452_56128 [Trifolium repens]
MVFGKKNDNRVTKNLSPPSEKCNKGKDRVDDNDDSIKTVLSDEDYIVFSFREDGSFNVVKDCYGAKSPESLTSVDGSHGNSKSVTRKLHYEEDAEQVRNHDHIEKNISNSKQDIEQCDQVNMTPFKEGEAKENTNLSPTQHGYHNGRSWQTEKNIDSRSSNQSEGSTSSFAFPEITCGSVESPAKFPISEDLHLNKQKIRCGRFQCFRFR